MADTINAKVAQAREAGYTDAEILDFLSNNGTINPAQTKVALENGYKPAEVLAYAIKAQPQTFGDKVLNSPIGGVVRGARDIVDGGAQLLTRGLEAAMPAGSAAEAYFRNERQRVEGINKEAERDYQQNWRRGEMQGFDSGRLAGNILATLPLMRLGPAGVSTAAAVTRGIVQGGAGGALQPVQNPGPEGDSSFWQQKATQTGVGAGVGAAGGYVGSKIGNALQGSDRVNAIREAEQRAANQTGNASATINANPTATVQGGGSTLGRVGPDPSAGLNEAQRRAMEEGARLGFRTTPGQATGSRSLQQMEARMESSPFFSGPFNTLKTQNQNTLNRTAANAIGETAETLDSAVLGRAQARLGQVFDDIGNNVKRVIPADDVVDRLAAVEQQFDGLLPRPLLNEPLVQRFMNLTTRGEMTGAQLRDLSSKLGRASKNQMTSTGGDRELGRALGSVKDVVDDVLGESLDPASRAAYDAARQQYRTLMLLTQRQNVVNPASGNVSGANLAAALQAADRPGYLFGRNNSDLYNAARFAQTFKPIVGDSGTATRTMEMTPWNALLSMPTRVAARAYVSQPAISAAQRSRYGLMPNAIGNVTADAMRRYLPLTSGVGTVGLLND